MLNFVKFSNEEARITRTSHSQVFYWMLILKNLQENICDGFLFMETCKLNELTSDWLGIISTLRFNDKDIMIPLWHVNFKQFFNDVIVSLSLNLNTTNVLYITLTISGSSSFLFSRYQLYILFKTSICLDGTSLLRKQKINNFFQSFGCPKANLGPLAREHPH